MVRMVMECTVPGWVRYSLRASFTRRCCLTKGTPSKACATITRVNWAPHPPDTSFRSTLIKGRGARERQKGIREEKEVEKEGQVGG